MKIFLSVVSISSLVIFSCSNSTSTEDLLLGSFIEAPVITIISPLDETTDVVINTKIIIHSTQELDLETMTAGVLLKDSSDISISYTVLETADRIYELSPDDNLQESMTYNIEILTELSTISGNNVEKGYTSKFTTSDITSPFVISNNIVTREKGTTNFRGSITFNEEVSGVALSAGSIEITANKGCMQCVTLSNLSGTGAGPYTFDINNIMNASEYTLTLGSSIEDVRGNTLAPMSLAFNVKPEISMTKNIGGRGEIPATGWGIELTGSLTTVDESGNIYIMTPFHGTYNFGTGPVVSANDTDIIITKMNSAGAVLWVKHITEIPALPIPYSIVANNNGVYLALGAYGSVVFDPNFSTNDLATMIVKLNSSDGSFAWHGYADSAYNDIWMSLSLRNDGIVVGQICSISSKFEYNGGVLVGDVTSSGRSFMLIGLDSDGNNAFNAIEAGPEVTAYAWAFDESNNMYIAGTLANSTQIISGDTDTQVTTVNSTNLYIAKISPSGDGLWAKFIGGNDQSAAIKSMVYHDSGTPADTSDDYLYFAGHITGEVDFGSTVGTIGRASNTDIFLAKIKADGSEDTLWAKSFGGNLADNGLNLHIYDNELYLISRYNLSEANLAYNNFGGIECINTLKGWGDVDLLLSIYDLSGNFISARLFGGYYMDLISERQSSFMTSDGKLGITAIMRGQVSIGKTAITPTVNPPDIIFWTME